MSEVKFVNVVKEFEDEKRGTFRAVNNANFSVRDKEFLVFVGPSGCGKTTSLRMIAGLERQTSGDIFIGDRLVNKAHPKDRDIAMVFQDYALYPHMTIRENLAFGLKNLKTPKDEIDRKIKEAASVLSIENLLDRKPRELSGGQKQRIAVGRAIVRNPSVFLFDEPLSNLDAKLRVQMRVELAELHKRLQTTVVYVTHDQVEAMTLGERIVVMNHGEIQQIAPPEELYDMPNNMFVAGFIGAPQMNMIDAAVAKSGSQVTLSFGGHTIALPDVKGKRLEEAGYVGKTVTLGIRPEDLHDEESFLAMSPNSVIEATIRVYEMLGSEVLLYFDVDDANFTAKVNPRTTARPGDHVKLALDMEKVHIFDKDSEKVILN